MVIKAVREIYPSVYVAYQAYTNDDVEFLWSLPGKVVPMLNRLKGYTRPIPFVEDVAVPPEAVHEFLLRAQKVFQIHEVTASLYSHAAAGQLHLRPFLPAPSPQDGAKLEAIARDLYQVVFSVGGTISGEHGDGLSRTAFIRSQYGPLYKVFQQVKELFDPQNLLNPNKIISDDPHITQRNIRPAAVPAPQVVDLQLRWQPEDMMRSTASCNGCGSCRTQDADLRMCPFLRIDVREEASPRAKANVMRDYATGLLDPREIASPNMKALSDLCFNCKQCQLECPANVDIPQMMIEAKAAYVAANGLFGADWLLSRIHSFGALGSTASMAVN
jgi:heterodisulfide reductase subunit C